MYFQNKRPFRRPFNNRGGNNFHRRTNRFSRMRPSSNVIYSYIQKASLKKTVVEETVIPTIDVNELSISSKLKNNILRRGFNSLTPIQEKGILPILQGQNVIGIANTGTGKTAAFLIPLIEKITQNPQYHALIITPTRELALQVREELQKLAFGLPVYSTFCIGQSPMRNQIYELKRNPHVVVGTPGRLKDFIKRGYLRLNTFSMLVLDEVDQMLDMGFIRDIKEIISYLPKERQSLFFSATISSEINRLIQTFVTNPVTVSVKKTETTSHIKQDIVKVENGSKIQTLFTLLQGESFKKVLVFGRTKMGVERLSRDLYGKGIKTASIHGDKPQYQRQQAIRMFKEDRVTVLVATDVAARGLDIPNVTHVINFDAPATYEDYIHRIGRTGRANNQGAALTFIE